MHSSSLATLIIDNLARLDLNLYSKEKIYDTGEEMNFETAMIITKTFG